MFSSLIQALRKFLIRMGVEGNLARSLTPGNFDDSVSYNVSKYLQFLKAQSKIKFDHLCNKMANKHAGGPSSAISEVVTVVPRSHLNEDFFSHPVVKGTCNHNVY